jgi:hypothetical protein
MCWGQNAFSLRYDMAQKLNFTLEEDKNVLLKYHFPHRICRKINQKQKTRHFACEKEVYNELNQYSNSLIGQDE